jgi:hypothetical protein
VAGIEPHEVFEHTCDRDGRGRGSHQNLFEWLWTVPYPDPYDSGRQRSAAVFPDEFNDTFAVGAEPGNNAFFGLNVLQGLVEHLRDASG